MIKELLVVLAAVTVAVCIMKAGEAPSSPLGGVSASVHDGQGGSKPSVVSSSSPAVQTASDNSEPAVVLAYDREVGEPCTVDAECRTQFCFYHACRALAPQPTPRKQVILVDDFYMDAMELRESVLKNGVFEVKGNYPGIRTKPMVTQSTKDYLVRILGKNFTYWPTDQYNGAFQYTLKSHKSWIHCDETQWAGIVYLTPDAPANGGTRFYRHKASRLTEKPTDADGIRLGFKNGTDLMNYIYKDSQNYDKWDLVDEVGNVFNRLILFRGARFHQSAEYFGDNLYNARLFQTFFFDVGGF